MNLTAFALANLLGGYARGRKERLEFEEERRRARENELLRDRAVKVSEEQLAREKARDVLEQEQAAIKRDREAYDSLVEQAKAAANALNPEAVTSAVAQANRIAEARGFPKVTPEMFRPGAGVVADTLKKAAESGLPWSSLSSGVYWGLGAQPPAPGGAPAPAPTAGVLAPRPAEGPLAPSLGIAAVPRPAVPQPVTPPSPDLAEESYNSLARRLWIRPIVDDIVKMASGVATGAEIRNLVSMALGEEDPGKVAGGTALSLRQEKLRAETDKVLSEAELNRLKATYIPKEYLLKEEELKRRLAELEQRKKEAGFREKYLETQLELERLRLEIQRALAQKRMEYLDARSQLDIDRLSTWNLDIAARSASWDTPLNQQIARDAYQRSGGTLGGSAPGGGAQPPKGAQGAQKPQPALSPKDKAASDKIWQWRTRGAQLADGTKVEGRFVTEFAQELMRKGKSYSQILDELRGLGVRDLSPGGRK